jgi:hypothetical protein
MRTWMKIAAGTVVLALAAAAAVFSVGGGAGDS